MPCVSPKPQSRKPIGHGSELPQREQGGCGFCNEGFDGLTVLRQDSQNLGRARIANHEPDHFWGSTLQLKITDMGAAWKQSNSNRPAITLLKRRSVHTSVFLAQLRSARPPGCVRG